MYRSYSVNDMPQPIRYYDRGETQNTVTEPPERRGEADAAADKGCETNKPDKGPPKEPCPQNGPPQCQPGCAQMQCCPVARGVKENNKGGLLANLKSDDVILIAVALVLLMDGCDDKLLIAALGLVFFSDYFGL